MKDDGLGKTPGFVLQNFGIDSVYFPYTSACLARGIDVETLHRIATMAGGGFDSLPHCGAIVAMLAITGLSHKQAYKDVGIVTVVLPVIAVVIAILVASIAQ